MHPLKFKHLVNEDCCILFQDDAHDETIGVTRLLLFQENASRALVSFKSPDHCILAMEARLETPSSIKLVQIKAIPDEALGISASAVYTVEVKCEEIVEPGKPEENQIEVRENCSESNPEEGAGMHLEEEVSDVETEGEGNAENKAEDAEEGEDHLTWPITLPTFFII